MSHPITILDTTPDATPDALPLDVDAEFEAVVGGLEDELAEQRWGQETAVLTGMPGISTVHCLTVRVDPGVLPTL